MPDSEKAAVIFEELFSLKTAWELVSRNLGSGR
jgi:hypothetical protein